MNDRPCQETGKCSSSCIFYDFACGCIIGKVIEEPRYGEDKEN